MNIQKQIYKEMKKANKIVIARHVGPDPDALGSTLGLKQVILDNFPNKEVYVVGSPAAKFNFIGKLDKFTDDMYDALLIVIDTPDKERIDGVDVTKFKKSIKIDHHPFVEQICTLEWIDCSASSVAQMIIEWTINNKLNMSLEAAEKLYIGLVADTGRFMFSYSTPKTFYLAGKLIEISNLDIGKIYNKLYTRPYKEIKFHGYLSQNFTITENKVGYIIIEDEILKEFDVDAATAGNMVNGFNHIEEMLVWVTCTYDKELELYRISIRSRGPSINEVAAQFGGGGHAMASGSRIKTKEEIEELIKALEEVTLKYIEETK